MADGAEQFLANIEQACEQALLADAAWVRRKLAGMRRRVERGQPIDRGIREVERRLKDSAERLEQRQGVELCTDYPEELPVAQRREEILKALADHRVVVLTGETGSGKTTQLPKMLWELGYGRRGLIGMTQPRRVAAMAVARRIAEEMQAPDHAVAHAVRFDDASDSTTAVRIMTDGLLLSEAGRDRDLDRYEVLIVDEAHERSLNIDVLLGLLRRLLDRRSDLRVVVTSASIDAEAFSQYFDLGGEPAPILAVGGRAHPVEVRYQPPGDSDHGYLAAAISALRDVHEVEDAGDVLCFLPTERDILETERRLRDIGGATVLPLFSRLNPHEQQRVFAPARGRKIVLATNIAETSLTVPGIRFVVDAGMARTKRYAAGSRTERLPIEAVSQASAIQRAGRAGRLGPGICIRLYSEEDFIGRPAYTQPEILRSNLAGVLLTALEMGWGEPESFPWLEPPSDGAWGQARQLLAELGALSGDGRLTRQGKRMARLPCDPQLARMLLAGVDAGVSHEVCTIAAYLSVQDPRLRPVGEESKADAAQRGFNHEAGDLLTALSIWDGYQAAGGTGAKKRFCSKHMLGFRRMREWADVRRQFWLTLKELRDIGRLPDHPHSRDAWPTDAIHRAVLCGLIGSIARWDGTEKCYRTAGNRQAHLHPGSALRWSPEGERRKATPPWLVAAELIETSRPFLRQAAPIDVRWIIDTLGDRLVRRHGDPYYDEQRQSVVAEERVTWKGLVLIESRAVTYRKIDEQQATRVFISEALGDGRLARKRPFFDANRALLRRLEGLGARLRDGSIHVDAEAVAERYAAVIGDAVITGDKDLAAWCKDHDERQLRFAPEDLIDRQLWHRAKRLAPEQVRLGGQQLPVRYRLAPGDADDGATLRLREGQVELLRGVDVDRLVPILLTDRVEGALRSLPKDQRRRLIPLRQTAEELAEALADGTEPLVTALVRSLTDRLGERPELGAPAADDHARLRFEVTGPDGTVLYAGRDIDVLFGLTGSRQDPVEPLRATWLTPPGTEWPGDVPESAQAGGTTVYPALVRSRGADAGVAVQRTCFIHQRAAAAWHADGLAALLEARLDDDLAMIALGPGSVAGVDKYLGLDLGALRRALCLTAALDVIDQPVRDAEGFTALYQAAIARLQEVVPGLDDLIRRQLAAARQVDDGLRRGASGFAAAAAAATVADDRRRLLAPAWTARLPWWACRRLPRYLEALAKRIDKPLDGPAASRRQRLVDEWQQLQDTVPQRLIKAVGRDADLRRAAGALEEVIACAALGGKPAEGVTDGSMRQVVWDLQRLAEDGDKADRRLRHRLLEIRPYLERAGDGPVQRALLSELDRQARDLPDLSLGCDLDQQRALATDLLREIQRFLEA